MTKNKGTKIHNRVRKVIEETLFKLYNNLPYKCQSCIYNSNCTNIEHMDDTMDCENYKMAIGLNELIEMMKEQNICIDSFCDKYGLKKEFFMEMIKGKLLFNYKYYIALCTRLHIIDEFEEYKERFKENEIENNTSKCEVKNI